MKPIMKLALLAAVLVSVLACGGAAATPTPTPGPPLTPSETVQAAVERWTATAKNEISEALAAALEDQIPVNLFAIEDNVREGIDDELFQVEVGTVITGTGGRLSGDADTTLPFSINIALVHSGNYTVRYSYSVVVQDGEVIEANLDSESISLTKEE